MEEARGKSTRGQALGRISIYKEGMQLYVPKDIVRMIPPGSRFRCEMVEEGILFRLLPVTPPVPSWAMLPNENGHADL